MRLLLLFALAALLCAPAHAQSGKAPPSPEEIGQAMARRLAAYTGVPVHIGALAFELLTSTFRARGVEVGSASQPILRIPQLRVQVPLLTSDPGANVALIEASEPRAFVAAKWLAKTPQWPSGRALSIRAVRVTRGELALRRPGGEQLVLHKLQLVGRDLGLSPGASATLAGTLSLRAEQVKIGEQLFSQLELEGKLVKDGLNISRLVLQGEMGQLELSGTLGLRGPGPLGLAGTMTLRLGSPARELTGTARLVAGRGWKRLRLLGQLQGNVQGLAPQGGIVGAPPLEVQLSVGGRRLRGTLARWRYR